MSLEPLEIKSLFPMPQTFLNHQYLCYSESLHHSNTTTISKFPTPLSTPQQPQQNLEAHSPPTEDSCAEKAQLCVSKETIIGVE